MDHQTNELIAKHQSKFPHFSLSLFAGYCAPTALAGLMDCTPLEAAETLASVPDMLYPSHSGCAVRNSVWGPFLEELGLTLRDERRTMEQSAEVVGDRLRKKGWDPEDIREIEEALTDFPQGGNRTPLEAGRASMSMYKATTTIYVEEGIDYYSKSVHYDTVSQWLKANPTAEGILNVTGHTLYVKDGKVVADTLTTTKSARRRVLNSYLL